MHKSRRRAACSRPTEVLLLLQTALSEACSLLIIQFVGRCTALRVLCPQPLVVDYHFTFFSYLTLSFPPADLWHLFMRLLATIAFSKHAYQSRCNLPSCWTLISILAEGPKTSHSDSAQMASGTSLLNKRSGAAWLSVPTQCLLCLTIHYKWKVLQKLSFL